MSSKPGGKRNSWQNSVKKTMKIVIAILNEDGHSKPSLIKSFWEIFPEAQIQFQHPLTEGMIMGRAYWDLPSKNNENPLTNPRMKYYVPAAYELIRRWKNGQSALSNDELEIFCRNYDPVVKTMKSRRNITDSTKEKHIQTVSALGGMCPCCSRVKLVSNGKKIAGEFDHFYANSKADFKHSWLICKVCHDKVTYGKADRPGEYTDVFTLYQKRAADLNQEAAE